MRRYLGIILTIAVVLLVLLGLNAVSFLKLDRQPESEGAPNRSSYHTGPTGTRAFYQLLEESGYQVARWRGGYNELASEAKDATLVMIGPSPVGGYLSPKEASELKTWVVNGGRLLIISREPQAQFNDWSILALNDDKVATEINEDPTPERLIDPNSDVLIAQPTALTRGVRGLAVSRLAARLSFPPKGLPTPAPKASAPPPPPKPSPTGQTEASPSDMPTPPLMKSADKAKPNERGRQRDDEAESDEEDAEAVTEEKVVMDGEPFYKTKLEAPVVHLGDSKGAVLADFDYGKGRVIFLSDPFVIANNGVARGANLTLALNLVNALGGRGKRFYFDEAMHGFENTRNPLFNYFHGTPVPWVFGQGLLIALLIAFSFSRRFARPLPLPQEDRHSPLEFVGSMANLQQVAQARDLALENIYPRFRARLCRQLGLSGKAKPEEIAAALNRRRLKVSADELRSTMQESERALNGGEIDDQRLLDLIATMRRISAQMK